MEEIPHDSQSLFFRFEIKDELPSRLKPMNFVPEGTFIMGQEGIATPEHEVTLSPFLMDVHETTAEEWNRVKDWAASAARGDAVYTFDNPGTALGANHPVGAIHWFDAVKWANARSEWEGLQPVYYLSPNQQTVYRRGNVEITNDCVDWQGTGYRLPTEAEWEYAARGGLEGKLYPWGDDPPDETKSNYAFLVDATTAVGSYPPNGFGLFDMAGNVREWCWDLHKEFPGVNYAGDHTAFAPYDSEPAQDPRGPLSGPRGMARGGSWLDKARFIQCARRHNDERTRIAEFMGFRLVTAALTK